jgi:hypothetical protein
MFSGWLEPPKIIKIGFDDLLTAIKYPNEYIIINTLSVSEQDCLIKSTLPYTDEEQIVNDLLTNYGYKLKKVIIYGKNSADMSTDKKAKQLISLGFHDVYLYAGGLFEWLLLQDVYGKCEFPTVGKMGDILAFKPSTTFRSSKI